MTLDTTPNTSQNQNPEQTFWLLALQEIFGQLAGEKPSEMSSSNQGNVGQFVQESKKGFSGGLKTLYD